VWCEEWEGLRMRRGVRGIDLSFRKRVLLKLKSKLRHRVYFHTTKSADCIFYIFYCLLTGVS
jgi:hypothetical protein